ncbi:MAG: prepilin-type N-terminal cleavage/methylation domain-containing protein [Acetobacterium woodii]|nr:prepilin-type N-terminal cleavage/methylation domain-containing protein [Acetobacterium woodii]
MNKKSMNKKIIRSKNGYTIMELLISLSILSLLTVAMLTTAFGSGDSIRKDAYESECQQILFVLLEYQNEAIMDGYRRQVRFLDGGVQVSWTKDRVNHKVYIPVKTLTFSGDFTGAAVLNLYEHGTVSQGGTLYLTSLDGAVKKIVVQVGNGRIYLDGP